jgi:hypothetical protein
MISEDQLRALVRESIQRHLQGAGTGAPVAIDRAHPSHGRFQLPSGGDSDGACLIEPAVRCTHCGYCQSYGH